jgi:hypothetical protein
MDWWLHLSEKPACLPACLREAGAPCTAPLLIACNLSLLGQSSPGAHPCASARLYANAIRTMTMAHCMYQDMHSTPESSFPSPSIIARLMPPAARLAYQRIPCTGASSSYLTSRDCSCVRLRNGQALNPAYTPSTFKGPFSPSTHPSIMDSMSSRMSRHLRGRKFGQASQRACEPAGQRAASGASGKPAWACHWHGRRGPP